MMETLYSPALCWTTLLICLCGLSQTDAECLNSSHFEMTFTSNTLIDKVWFKNCTSARHFNISNNKITSLENETFNVLWNVEVMDLSNNEIASIEQDTFAIMRVLQHLDLSNNDITDIPRGFFNNKNNLVKVDLSYNKITHIPRMVLEYDLKSIELISLHHNRITAFEPWAVFRNLIKMVDVRFNNISTFSNVYNFKYDSRSVYDEVTTDMRNNSLTTWHDWYVLQYKQANSTTNTVEAAIVEMMPDIRDNPFNCDCNIYYLTKRLKNSFLGYSGSEYLDIVCYNPPHLTGKRLLYDIMLSQLICNISEDCPAGCLCQDRPYSNTLNVDCTNLGLTEVPSKVPIIPNRMITLQLDNNFITEFKNVSYLPYIYSVTMSNNSLRSVSREVMKQIASKRENARLDFTNNSLTSIPREAQNIKFEHAQLKANHFACSCEMLWMADWIILAPSYAQKELSCTFEGNVYTIMNIDESTLNCKNIGNIILVVVLSVICVVVIALLVTAKRCPYETKVLLFKIFRIHPSDKYLVDKSGDKEYDMYVCFDDNDPYVRQWVMKVLFRRLEGQKPFYKLCAAMRNGPTGSEAEGRLQLIDNSRRMLIILSKDYETSKWCDYETCHSETLEHNHGRIMYLLYDSCAVEDARQEPWLSKMKDRKVFSLHDRMLWSKLRYELPTKPVLKKEAQRNKDIVVNDSRVDIHFNQFDV